MNKHFSAPNFTLGILGGGQLGRMLLQKTVDFNISTAVMDGDADAPCKNLCTLFVNESFTDEECWHYLRFRKPELHRLFIVTDFPQEVRCENGVTCLGEYAFCLMLYRLAYPCRLFNLQNLFGREFTQLSRIFKLLIPPPLPPPPLLV